VLAADRAHDEEHRQAAGVQVGGTVDPGTGGARISSSVAGVDPRRAHPRVAALNALAYLLQQTGRMDEATQHVEEGLALARRVQDRGGEGRLLGTLGLIWRSVGAYERATAA
jgi:hypothetical protein